MVTLPLCHSCPVDILVDQHQNNAWDALPGCGQSGNGANQCFGDALIYFALSSDRQHLFNGSGKFRLANVFVRQFGLVPSNLANVCCLSDLLSIATWHACHCPHPSWCALTGHGGGSSGAYHQMVQPGAVCSACCTSASLIIS